MRSIHHIKPALAVLYIFLITIAVYNNALLPASVFLPADLLLLTAPWRQHAAELLPGFHAVSRPAWDPLFQFYPARKFLTDSLHIGHIPLWNPSAFSGTPFAADGQSAVFYPPNWLFALLPLSLAFGWVAALHTFLAGLFFLMYGRRMGWGWAAALTGATAWMLCGVMVAWQMWQVIDAALCWLPLALYFWEAWRQTGRSSRIVGMGIALGLSALAGHLQFTCYAFLLVIAYGIFRSFASHAVSDAENLTRSRSVAGLVGGLALGVGIAGVQLLTTLDFLGHTNRASLPLTALLGSSMPAGQLLMLVAPDVFGGQRDWTHHPYIGQYGQPSYYELTSFCGAAALAFAAYGIQFGRDASRARSRTLFWLGVAIFALLMACGSPLYALFYYGVPLFKSFHGPARILVLLDFAVAVLAAEGVHRLSLASPADRRVAAARILGILLVAVLLGYRFAVTNSNKMAGFALTHPEPDGWLGYSMTQIGIAAAMIVAACAVLGLAPARFAWAAVAVVAVDSLLFAVGVNSSVPAKLLYPQTADTEFVSGHLGTGRVWCVGDGNPRNAQSKLVPNSAMALGWRDISGSDPLILKSYEPIYNQLDAAQASAPPASELGSVQSVRSLLDRLDARYIVSPRPMGDNGLSQAYQGDIDVYENLNAYGVARLISDAGTAAGQPLPATVEPGRISILLPGQAGLISTSTVFDPGWRATVDGHRTDVAADAVYLAARVPAGARTLNLHYLPASVASGLYVSCLSWLIAAAVLFSEHSSVRRIRMGNSEDREETNFQIRRNSL